MWPKQGSSQMRSIQIEMSHPRLQGECVWEPMGMALCFQWGLGQPAAGRASEPVSLRSSLVRRQEVMRLAQDSTGWPLCLLKFPASTPSEEALG